MFYYWQKYWAAMRVFIKVLQYELTNRLVFKGKDSDADIPIKETTLSQKVYALHGLVMRI